MPRWTFGFTSRSVLHRSRSLGLRLALWLWAAAPAVFLAWALTTGQGLGVNPQEEILRGLGQLVLVILLWIYAMPVWAQYYGPQILASRRAMGLWAFSYAALHFVAYAQFEHDAKPFPIFYDIAQRPFVSMGLVALLILTLMAVTSNRWSIRKLSSGWKRLHRLLPLAIFLGLAHFFLHKLAKNDFFLVWLYTGAFVFIALIRRLRRNVRR